MTDCLLDGSITKDIYAQKHDELQNRRMEINQLLEKNTAGDGQFKIALSTLLSLSSRIGPLFDGSKPDEKRRLIGFVFSNLEMEGSKLRFSLRKPFDLFVDLSPYGIRTRVASVKEMRIARQRTPMNKLIHCFKTIQVPCYSP
jgi:site-specific DNA recombinase